MLVTHAGLRTPNGDLAFEVAFRNLHTDAPRGRECVAACKAGQRHGFGFAARARLALPEHLLALSRGFASP